MTPRLPIVYDTAPHPFRLRMPASFARLHTGKPMGDFQLFLMTFASAFLAFYGFLS